LALRILTASHTTNAKSTNIVTNIKTIINPSVFIILVVRSFKDENHPADFWDAVKAELPLVPNSGAEGMVGLEEFALDNGFVDDPKNCVKLGADIEITQLLLVTSEKLDPLSFFKHCNFEEPVLA
jgi:hypothetical protein